MENFNELQLHSKLLDTLNYIKFLTPTPIQEKAIPIILEGKDVLGSAQTGTGKTGAFGIPVISQMLTNPQGSALIMTPTRELAAQVLKQLETFLGKQSDIKTALLIGGEPMPKQLQQLKRQPRIIVGTPGRINDHLERRTVYLRNVSWMILDETDRMLDMGFMPQIERIVQQIPKKRQTLMFSATMPHNISKLSEKYLNEPVRVSVDNTSSPAENIKQEMIQLSETEKYSTLTEQLEKREGSIIIFVKTKYGTQKLAQRLSKEGHSADAIHGDLRQNKRDRVIASFRKKKYRILVATDVAARGLDIPHIEHVVNYDLPQCSEDYIHRIGRTARAGAKGHALCFVTPKERGKWHAIERLINPDAAPHRSKTDANKHSKPFFKRGRTDNKGSSSKPFFKRNSSGFKRKPKAATAN